MTSTKQHPDLLIVNSIGPGFTLATSRGPQGLGGSELEIVQIAHALQRRGHRVVVANGVEKRTEEEGVVYMPLGDAAGMMADALWIERFSPPPKGIRTKRIIIRATDIDWNPYSLHRGALERGAAAVALNTTWQAESGFQYAKEKILIPPALDYDCGEAVLGPVEKVPGRFVYASAPMKGLDLSLAMWRRLSRKYAFAQMAIKPHLIVTVPGFSDMYGDKAKALSDEDRHLGITFQGMVSLIEWRRLIASAEGLFFVSQMNETFGCVAAFAEHYGTRPHILCRANIAGFAESLSKTVCETYVTQDEKKFEKVFVESIGGAPIKSAHRDLSPDTLAALWERALQLTEKHEGKAKPSATSAIAFRDGARAGTHIGFYPNPHTDGQQAQRYWVHDRILVGGSIMGTDDAEELRKLGITHVLSAEAEQDDAGKWPDDKRARHEWPDHGLTVDPGLIHKIIDYATGVLSDEGTSLYVHCKMGGSRGPTLGYIVLRAVFKFSPSEAMMAIRATRGMWTPHLKYIESVEHAIESLGGREVDAHATRIRVVEAYKGTPTPQAYEADLPQEELTENHAPLPEEFGKYLSALRSALSVGGSEFGLGLMLMSLTASVRASRVVEIGRFRGFSTLALASGLALADAGWLEPMMARQRPDVDYDKLLEPKKRTLMSIDRAPTIEADDALEKAGLAKYVEKLDMESDAVDLSKLGPVDVLLIDGSHQPQTIRNDISRFVPHVRPGGYFVLHDYFGWYGVDGKNGSTVKAVIDQQLGGFEQLLIDTGFASFVIFRKNIDLPPQPARVHPRADGRPTVGLVLIAKGDEAATVIARAIVSAKNVVDAITVVSDGGQQTVEVCRALGADVYQRKSPEIDWVKGIGHIPQARNDALEIAEKKTDFVLMLDPDDYYEGELPKELPCDVYEITIHDAGLKYRRAQLYRSDRHFRYVGIIHESLNLDMGKVTIGRVDSLKYVRGHGGHQDRQPAAIKYGQHARWLEKWLIDHPNDTRSQFYLAQSYRDAGMHDKAIAAYEKRITMMNGWEEERAFSAVQIARIHRETGKDPTSAYLRAYEMRPSRAEALCELAMWLRDDKQKRFALAVVVARMAASIPDPSGTDALFLEPAVYEWRALEELAISLYWAGDKIGSRDCYAQLLDRAPPFMTAHFETMHAMCRRETGT